MAQMMGDGGQITQSHGIGTKDKLPYQRAAVVSLLDTVDDNARTS